MEVNLWLDQTEICSFLVCRCPGVDSSAAAISLAVENAAMSSHGQPIDFQCQEVEQFMASAAKQNQLWDIVILGESPFGDLMPDCVLKTVYARN